MGCVGCLPVKREAVLSMRFLFFLFSSSRAELPPFFRFTILFGDQQPDHAASDS